MRKEMPTLKQILEMDNPDLYEIYFGDLYDRVDIRNKICADPKYKTGDNFFDDIAAALIIDHDNNFDLARAELRRRVAIKHIRDDLEFEKQRISACLKKMTLPSVAIFLLYASVPEDCIGDLEELYQKIARDRGVREATIWLWCQVAKSVFHFAFAAIRRAINLSDLLDWIFKTL